MLIAVQQCWSIVGSIRAIGHEFISIRAKICFFYSNMCYILVGLRLSSLFLLWLHLLPPLTSRLIHFKNEPCLFLTHSSGRRQNSPMAFIFCKGISDCNIFVRKNELACSGSISKKCMQKSAVGGRLGVFVNRHIQLPAPFSLCFLSFALRVW